MIHREHQNRGLILYYCTVSTYFASQSGHVEMVKHLIINYKIDVNTKVDSKCRTPLMIASQYGHEELVQMLLKNDAKVDEMTIMEMSALSYASRQNYLNIVKILCENGADVNFGFPILYASKFGNKEIVQYLMDQNADLDISYFWAAQENGHAEIAKLITRKLSD